VHQVFSILHKTIRLQSKIGLDIAVYLVNACANNHMMIKEPLFSVMIAYAICLLLLKRAIA
jgi:hypothetical protein